MEVYQRHGIVLRQGYGLTEVGVNCFSMSSREAVAYAGTVGRPMAFTEAKIVSPEGDDVGVGHVGELLLRGPHVSLGYWKNPEATAAAYDAEGFFHTGDLAQRSEQGMVFIVGRKTDMFISGGVNIYPAEIEAELLEHEHVADAAVVGIPDSTWGEIGVAFILPERDCSVDPEQINAFLLRRLAKYKIPKDIVLVASLPRTAYGKVRKNELRRAYLDDLVESVNPEPVTVATVA